jgi:hypothetical protein
MKRAIRGGDILSLEAPRIHAIKKPSEGIALFLEAQGFGKRQSKSPGFIFLQGPEDSVRKTGGGCG